MSDTFFSQERCDRCGGLLSVRTMSWFTNQTICVDKCGAEEKELRRKLPNHGRDLEGCGYIPEAL